MKNIIRIFVLFIVLISLSSCYNYKSLQLLQEEHSSPVYNKSNYSDYRIQVNDEIIYRLITSDETVSKLISPQTGGSSQNMMSYRIYKDSTIDLPFISHIPIAGLTIS